MAPTYDFRCRACGRETEEVHSMSTVPDEIRCTVCAGSCERVISSAPPFHLGEGAWYRNGYRGKDNFKYLGGSDDSDQ